IRPPSAVTNPAPPEIRKPCNLVGVGLWSGELSLYFKRQLRRHALVRVDGKHPGTACQIQGPVLLPAKTGPVVGQADPGAFSLRDFTRSVRAAGVDDNNFIGKTDRVDAFANMCRLVFGDDD